MTVRDIGVAIAIPEPYRTELQDWRERLGDPNAGFIVPHITLLGPTPLPQADMVAVEEHLASVAEASAPFRIQLTGSGTFRPLSPVVYVTLSQGISRCEILEEAVRSGPLLRSLRFAYHPHVTVAHDIDDEGLDQAFAALTGYSARFDVDGFSLFERGEDQMWRVLRHYTFGPAGNGSGGGRRGYERLADRAVGRDAAHDVAPARARPAPGSGTRPPRPGASPESAVTGGR